jgi:hypothetical protein
VYVPGFLKPYDWLKPGIPAPATVPFCTDTFRTSFDNVGLAEGGFVVNNSKRLIGIAAMVAIGLFWTVGNLVAQGRPVTRRVNIPSGTVIELRMDTGLDSGSSQVNDAFRASVTRSVWIDGIIAIPGDSVVDGRVTMAQPAASKSKSGVIGVAFTQITIDGKPYAINGVLTSLAADERGQILEEGGVQGASSTGRNTVFIGGGAGAGTAIGALAGGGKGAGIGALAGGGLGILGALLSHGEEARVPVGSTVAVELTRQITVTVETSAPNRQSRNDDRTLYASANLVRGAQAELRQRGYYQGQTNGRLDTETRRAIAHFQIDQSQPATGDLDHGTAVELGLVQNDNGPDRQRR